MSLYSGRTKFGSFGMGLEIQLRMCSWNISQISYKMYFSNTTFIKYLINYIFKHLRVFDLTSPPSILLLFDLTSPPSNTSLLLFRSLQDFTLWSRLDRFLLYYWLYINSTDDRVSYLHFILFPRNVCWEKVHWMCDVILTTTRTVKC